MRTHLLAQRTMVWMSWWEKRKASRATTTPATWILPSSGQSWSSLSVNTLSAIVYAILMSLDFSHIDWLYGASSAGSAVLPRGRGLLVNCFDFAHWL